MLTWYYVTRAQFDAAVTAGTVTDERLCFLSDTKEIYRGTKMFNESVEVYSTLPTTGIAMGKIYIDSTTLEGKIWNGSDWVTVIKPVQDGIGAINPDNLNPVTGNAVYQYMENYAFEIVSSIFGDKENGFISEVEYDSESNELVIYKGYDFIYDEAGNMTGTSPAVFQRLPMTNLAVDLQYDKTTGKLDCNGTTLGTAINLDLERFVSEASYDEESKNITLKFNDDSDALVIPIGDLVDTYTAEDSTTIKMTVTGNKFVAEAAISTDEGNIIQVKENGLYVAAVDISCKVDKVANATAGDIAVLTADGGIEDSAYSLGTAELGEGEKVVATEAAVVSYVNGVRDTLNESIEKKMSKVAETDVGQVIIASATGDSEASGYTIGGDTMDGSATKLATEAGAQAYVQSYAVSKANIVNSADFAAQVDAASDENVVSEKAVVDAMTWKTSF